MIPNSIRAAIPIWRQYQYGGYSNMTAIMECQIIQLNTIVTWRIRSIENPQPQIRQTNRHTPKIRVLRHSWLSNPPIQEAHKLPDKENILHSDQNDNWNMNSDRNYIKKNYNDALYWNGVT